MKHLRKKVGFLILVMSLLFSQMVPVFAATTDEKENQSSVSVITITPGKFESLSSEEISEDTSLPQFDSIEEFEEYINSTLGINTKEVTTIKVKKDNSETNTTGISLMSTTGLVTVSSYSALGATINLRLSYVTSGRANTGTILSVTPFTQFVGNATLLFWEENYVNATILPGGKDVSVSGSGVLTTKAEVAGNPIGYSMSVDLSGTAYLIR